jgi:hypothetical protein
LFVDDEEVMCEMYRSFSHVLKDHYDVETALGGQLQDIICPADADAKAAIGWLKSQQAGRATFLPLDLLKPNSRVNVPNGRGIVGWAADLVQYDRRYAPAIEHLLGRVLLVEDLDVAIALVRRDRLPIRVVSLDGEVVSGSGAVTGGRVVGSAGHTLWAGGMTFDNATLAGTLNSIADGAQIYARNMTFDHATVVLTDLGLKAPFVGTASTFQGENSNQTLAGTGTILFNGTSDFSAVGAYSQSGRTLTLGPGITVKTGTVGGTVGFWDTFTSTTLINQGTVLADAAGKTITLHGKFWTNEGKIEARNGGIIKVYPGIASSGTPATTLNNISGTTLTGGKYVVAANSTIEFRPGTSITTARSRSRL